MWTYQYFDAPRIIRNTCQNILGINAITHLTDFFRPIVLVAL